MMWRQTGLASAEAPSAAAAAAAGPANWEPAWLCGCASVTTGLRMCLYPQPAKAWHCRAARAHLQQQQQLWCRTVQLLLRRRPGVWMGRMLSRMLAGLTALRLAEGAQRHRHQTQRWCARILHHPAAAAAAAAAPCASRTTSRTCINRRPAAAAQIANCCQRQPRQQAAAAYVAMQAQAADTHNSSSSWPRFLFMTGHSVTAWTAWTQC